MSKPDPWRLDPAAYPHHDTIQTRFQDLDVLGHINNVAMAVLFESGRVRFNRAIGLLRPGGLRFLVARVEINYLAEGQFPADAELYHGIGRIGTRSWDILGLCMQGDTALATCDVTVVLSSAGGVSGLPDDLRAALGGLAIRSASA